MKQPLTTAIVGAGISGLAAAFEFSRNSEHVVSIFDSAAKPGGVLQTNLDGDFLIESSADMFVSDPHAGVELCQQLGIADQLVSPEKSNRFSSIVRKGKLIRTPAGFSLLAPNRIGSILSSPLLSPIGKLRFLMDYFVRPSKTIQDESLKSFTIRHYGLEVFERMVQPLVAGIYSADADRLSIQATLKRFVDMESEHGSLIKAARSKSKNQELENNSSGARYGMFLTPRNGIGSIVDALTHSITGINLQLDSPIEKIARHDSTWQLFVNGKSFCFDQVLLATSAKVSARLLANIDRQLSESLSEINFGSMAVVAITCTDTNFRHGCPPGFGFVVPEIENRRIIACSFSSNKFKGRAPSGQHLMRVFIGAPFIETAATMTDKQLQTVVIEELSELIGFVADNGSAFHVHRWMDCMPQYEIGHLKRIETIESHLKNHAGLQLAGSSYYGVGIPACIESGRDAAKKLM